MKAVSSFVAITMNWINQYNNKRINNDTDKNKSKSEIDYGEYYETSVLKHHNQLKKDTINKATTGIAFNKLGKVSEDTKSNIKEKKRVAIYAELGTTRGNDIPIQVLVKETLTSTAVEALESSEALAHELGKKLVLDALAAPESPGQLGLLLGYIFDYESVLQPTRELVYWSLALPTTYSNIEYLTKQQRDYFLGLTSERPAHILWNDMKLSGNYRSWGWRAEGFEYTKNNLLDIAAWWCSHPLTPSQAVAPLMYTTYVEDREMTQYLAGLCRDTIQDPTTTTTLTTLLISTIQNNLQSEETKNAAKEIAVKFVSSYIGGKSSGKSSDGSSGGEK